MKYLFVLAAIGTLLAFAGNTALADTSDGAGDGVVNVVVVDTYTAMDDSNDGIVSKQEFSEYREDSAVFQAMDVNDDGRLGASEFGHGLYQYYDDNHDGYIDDAEWEAGLMVDDYGDNGFWDM